MIHRHIVCNILWVSFILSGGTLVNNGVLIDELERVKPTANLSAIIDVSGGTHNFGWVVLIYHVCNCIALIKETR